jgi:amino acid transporter
MSIDSEKGLKQESSGKIQVSAVPQDEFYDPSKESVLTRAGLNLESFKRAPGITR